MHIVCCIKQVPDTAQVKIDPDTNTLIRSGVESICNPYDLVATEIAVELTEKHGGTVTLVSMGPPQAESALRQCLALGAHEAILLSDRAFAGADTLATNYTLAQAIVKIASAEPVQLVICGKLAIDGDTGQTGPGIATRLGYDQITYVSGIIGVDPENGSITIRRELEDGSEVVEGKLPALLTVGLEAGTPRYASLPEMVRAMRQDIKVWGAADIGAVAERLGTKGSPTSVDRIFAPRVREGGLVFDTVEESRQSIEEFLNTFFSHESSLIEGLMAENKE